MNKFSYKHKTICCLLSLVFVLSVLFSSHIYAIDHTSGEEISVIIKVNDSISVSRIKEKITALTGESDYGKEYSLLFNGFSLSLDSKKLSLLESVDGIQIYRDTEYKPLSVEETDYTVVYAPGCEPDYFPERGKGAVVAVIDDGFYVKHSLFTLPDSSELALTPKSITEILHFTKASRLYPRLSIKNSYKSDKIPFAFDYADSDTDVSGNSNHGTAMLSLAVGNPTENEVVSAAPGAQALAMKVYSSNGGNAKTSSIIAALEDAYILGADAVCLSLGSPCGFSETGFYDTLLEETINKLYKNGITVVCPAGNDGAIGTDSLFYNHYGYYEPLTSLPDSGTVHAPSTSHGAISSASADTFSARTYAFRMIENGTFIPFSDSNDTVETLGKKPFYLHFENKSLEYVSIGGIGSKDDFTVNGKQLDLSGKIALIERGEITFTEKVNNAAANGALAVIIFDNGTSDTNALRTGMQLDGALIPAILISKNDGELMKRAVNKQIYIDPKIIYVTNAGITPSPSDFTSRGPTPTLDIKPEITAAGSSLSVADQRGTYRTVSGTSVSGAYMAGLAAAVSVSLDMPDTSEKADRVKALLMNAAEPMTETVEKEARYYSVTLQGAGYISSSASLQSDVFLTSNNQAKIVLGNNIGESFEIPLTLENLTDKVQSAELSAVIGTESYEAVKYSELCHKKDSFYKQHGIMLYDYLGKNPEDYVNFTGEFIEAMSGASLRVEEAEINEGNDNFTGKTIKLEPGERLNLTISVTLDRNQLDALGDVFENGMLVQGYIFAKGENTVSIPLLGCYGDFYKVSPLDSTLNEGGALYGGSYLYTFFEGQARDYTVYLGTNYDFTEKNNVIYTNDDLTVISPVAEGSDGSVFLSVNLLRNIKSLKADIYSQSGEHIYSPKEITGLKKAYFTDSSDDTNAYSIELWDLRDTENDKYIYDDGKYVCKLNVTDASDREFRYEFNFTVDSQKPELIDYKVRKMGKKTYLDVTVSDNTYIHKVVAYSLNSDELDSVSDTIPDDEFLCKNKEGTEFETSFDITSRAGQYIYIEITDLAFNKNLVRIKT